MMSKLNYLNRIFSAYILKKNSQLTFWHGEPEINPNANYNEIGEFYQKFSYKADYPGPFDKNGVIVLNYHGEVGEQKYHIAIAQYGLACYNRWKETGDAKWFDRFMNQVKWHMDNIKQNEYGIWLWYANFDWDYHGKLNAPWASGLAQGAGLSLLARAYKETKNKNYLYLCKKIFKSIITPIKKGGVMNTVLNEIWIEETLIPANHVLNGFIWSVMGVWDYYLITKDKSVREFFEKFIRTIKKNLFKFDTGYWSLYELSTIKMKMLASYFYHSLHIVQLKILYNITGEKEFLKYEAKWERYKNNPIYRKYAFIHKAIFKVVYF
jgi:rhamnogalacturonyl hydrolase YesR